MDFDLQRFLRALVFAATGPLSVKDIQGVLNRFHDEHAALPPSDEGEGEGEEGENLLPAAATVPTLVSGSQIREAMEALARELEEAGEVCRLSEAHNGWRLVMAPESAEWARLLRKEPRPVRLSPSAMETLAIVAYRQPVARSEIESIRGVSVDSALNRLMERELVRIVGRADLPGRPLQYGTTEQFLELLGIRSLDELPASDVLSSREIDDWLQRSRQQEVITEREMGLPDSGETEPEVDAHEELDEPQPREAP
ncbi:MAG: SMC-Scp complex subunit ScpB [Puniceicoccaceae bacterium]|nr:MAG: SMC-Scp complex subunit ScpB [Puniceicoccaceae bacterium]